MEINKLLSDEAILSELGERLSRSRIDQSLTQAELALQAGVSKRTVERAEAGASTQLSNMIRIMRVLDLLPNLEHALPATGPRPMDLLKRKGKVRQRASSGKSSNDDDAPWSWAEE